MQGIDVAGSEKAEIAVIAESARRQGIRASPQHQPSLVSSDRLPVVAVISLLHEPQHVDEICARSRKVMNCQDVGVGL